MKILLLLSVSAVVVALFGSAALAQTSGGSPTATASPTASPTASVTATAGSTAAATISAAASVSPTATATATATALSKTGGPSYIVPVTLAASLVLVLSGLAALRLTARRGAS
jgi:hypothetical protein